MKRNCFKKIAPLFLTGFVLFIGGCKKEEPAPMQMPPAIVKLMTVEQKDIPFESTFVGVAEGSKAVEVRAQVGGILRERLYEEGRYVNAGDVLFNIEPDTYEAALKAAKGNLDMANAQLRQTKLNYERILNLYNTGSVSQKDYDAALAAYESAKAQVESATGNLSDSKIRLGYTKVIAPVSGFTSSANYTEGNLISASSAAPLTVINQVDPIHVNFSVPSNIIFTLLRMEQDNQVRSEKNLTSTLYTADGVKYPMEGKIIFFDKIITSSTGNIKFKAEFPNTEPAQLFPNQYVRVSLNGFTIVNSIVIPQKAIIQRQGAQVVIVVDQNNIAHFTPIEVGMNLGNNFIVKSGLKPGDRIVSEGTNKVMMDNSPIIDMEAMKAQQQQQAAGAQQQQQGQPAKK